MNYAILTFPSPLSSLVVDFVNYSIIQTEHHLISHIIFAYKYLAYFHIRKKSYR